MIWWPSFIFSFYSFPSTDAPSSFGTCQNGCPQSRVVRTRSFRFHYLPAVICSPLHLAKFPFRQPSNIATEITLHQSPEVSGHSASILAPPEGIHLEVSESPAYPISCKLLTFRLGLKAGCLNHFGKIGSLLLIPSTHSTAS